MHSKKSSFLLKELPLRSSLVPSGLRVWHCHCSGSGCSPWLRNFCLPWAQPRNNNNKRERGEEPLLFCLFRATPTAHAGSQARGLIGTAAAGLHHSHSHAGSAPCLWPSPQLKAMPDPSPAERGQGSNPCPHGPCRVRCRQAATGAPGGRPLPGLLTGITFP